MTTDLLLRNNYVAVLPRTEGELSIATIGTVVSNFAYYGFVPSAEVLSAIMESDDDSVGAWWSEIDQALAQITGDDKNIGDFVVYKNFPGEVLEMSQAEYWTKQILMYWGLPNELFTEEALERESSDDQLSLKVLHLSDENTLRSIQTGLLAQPARWTDVQTADVTALIFGLGLPCDMAAIPFKENMVIVASEAIKAGTLISVGSATDVLRLGVALSDGDVSLRENTKFRNFKRPERRMLLEMLQESSANLMEDVAMRRGVWKRFLRNLHPSDYAAKCPAVIEAQQTLYASKTIATHASLIEKYIAEKDPLAIPLAVKRPGDFARRLQKMLSVFGMAAANPFAETVVPKLKTVQLLKLRNYLLFTNARNHRMFAPKGNWSRVQVIDNKVSIDEDCREFLLQAIDTELGIRINSSFPDGVTLDETADYVKLKDNDSTLTDYGRGTVFPIPDSVNFIRLSSYWECAGQTNVWYDNGVNFFNEEWSPVGTICWNETSPLFNQAAVFSGDPTNAKDVKGRACQMIDVYLDKLDEAKVRYAVWNILCYSNKKFSEAECVRASLQWGENPEKGKLFDPARCQLQFPIDSESLTSYIAYIDVKERKIVYMDAAFAGAINSAKSNESVLAANMPAYLEYLDTLPSVKDLFAQAKPGNGALVTYSDKDYELNGQKAYVFRPENAENEYDNIDLNSLL